MGAFRILVLLLAVWAVGARASQVLAVSALQTCTSVSVGTLQLNCSQTGSTATVLLARLDYTASGVAPTEFQFGVATLPTSPSQTLAGTSTTCDGALSPGNLCGYTSPTVVTMRMRVSPILVHNLVKAPSNFQIPFLYYYRLVDQGCADDTCTAYRNLNFRNCQLQGSSTSKTAASTANTAPTPAQILDQFANTVALSDNLESVVSSWGMRCPRLRSLQEQGVYMPPNGNITTPGEAAIKYTFICAEGSNTRTVTFYATFYQLQPMCNVYRIQNPPQIATVIEVDVTSGTGNPGDPLRTETVVIDTSAGQTTGVTADGSMLVRIANVQSPTGSYGPNDRGLIVVCGTSRFAQQGYTIDVPPLDMVRPGDSPLANPWLYLDDADRKWALPTPVIIQKILGRNVPATNASQFFYYIAAQLVQCVGTQCGQLGVSPLLYSSPPPKLFFDQYTRQFAQPPQFPYSAIQQIADIATCVPGFGLEYNSCNSTTPCTAVSDFIRLNQGPASQRQAAAGARNGVREFLMRTWNTEDPNAWVSGTRLFIDIPTDAAYEISIATTSTFVGVRGTVVDGSFDQSTGVGCAVDLANSFAGTAMFQVRVCSGVASDGQFASYAVYATCQGGLQPAAPAQRNTGPLGLGQCETVAYTIKVVDSISSTASCTAYLTNPVAAPTFDPAVSITLDTITVACQVGSFAPAPPVIKNASRFLPNGSIVAGLGNFSTPNKEANSIAWGVIVGVIAVVLIVVVAVGVAIYVQARRRTTPEVKRPASGGAGRE